MELRDAMAATGLDPGHMPMLDGRIRRFNVERHKGRGWYVAHDGGGQAPSVAIWADWGVADAPHKWIAGGTRPTRRDQAALRRLSAARDAERRAEQAEGASRAATRWQGLPGAPAGHPYLVRKHIAPLTARIDGDFLVVPVYSTGHVGAVGSIQSLQTIAADGTKRYTRGAAMAGGVCPLGVRIRHAGLIIICEGFATAATLVQAMPDASVLAAFHASNLFSVASWAAKHAPDTDIMMAADNDRHENAPAHLKKNVGLRMACGARDTIRRPFSAGRMLLAFPEFTAREVGTDFNDLAAARGVEAVTACIKDALS